jgi:hypothetical protein
VSKPQRLRIDPSTYATLPGGVGLSHRKAAVLHPEYFDQKGLQILAVWKTLAAPIESEKLEQWLRHGDCNPAIVCSLDPLLVSAYSEDLDCVAMLLFDSRVRAAFSPSPNQRLLSVNVYFTSGDARDLSRGPLAYPNWANFQPLIADFLTEDLERVQANKDEIPEHQWLRAEFLTDDYLSKGCFWVRDGRPLYSFKPWRTLKHTRP